MNYYIKARYIVGLLLLLMVQLNTMKASKTKTIMAVMLSQDEEHFLPYFLSFFERLSYPKNKISLFIRSGNNQDKTKEIIDVWLKENYLKYHSVNVKLDDNDYKYELSAEEALEESRERHFDYFWLLNQKTIIIYEDILQSIIKENLHVAAPIFGDIKSYFSNFWGKFTEGWYYERSEDYFPICNREKVGCFKAALLNSHFLIDLNNRKSKFLTFNKTLLKNYDGPPDGDIVFSVSALQYGIDLYICNKEDYGVIVSQYSNQYDGFQGIKKYVHQQKIPFNISDELLPFMNYPKPDNLGLDKIYIINLERRPKRKEIMKERLREAGLEATFINGVDGQSLNETYLSSIGYGPNKHYLEEFLTIGSIGCALSHYSAWEEAIKANYSKVLILEDDVTFEENFVEKVKIMFKEIEEINLDFDLIYLGRHPSKKYNIPVNNSVNLVTFDYANYDAAAYILSTSGLRKLHQQEYISNILPVDEYIAVKYWPVDKRNEMIEKVDFPVNLKAFSIDPLVVHQTRFLEEESDTINTQYHLDAFGQFAKPDLKQFNAIISNDEL